MTTSVKHEKIANAADLKDGDVVVNSATWDRFLFERGRYGYTLYDPVCEDNFFHLTGNEICTYYQKEVPVEEEVKAKLEFIHDVGKLKSGDTLVDKKGSRYTFVNNRYGHKLIDDKDRAFSLSGADILQHYQKEVLMEEETKKVDSVVKSQVSPLYDGMSVSAFYSDENSLKRIFDICYHFAEAFGGSENLYILPFMMGKTPEGKSYVDIHFWVNTDTLLKEPNFATEAEWWINGYIAGVENR